MTLPPNATPVMVDAYRLDFFRICSFARYASKVDGPFIGKQREL